VSGFLFLSNKVGQTWSTFLFTINIILIMITLSNHQFQELRSHKAAIQSHLDAIDAILVKAKLQESNLVFDPSSMYPKQAMTKKELAHMLGISSRNLAYQLKELRPLLREKGVSDRAKLLPPHVVYFLCLSLDIEKKNGVNCKKLQPPE
jgi:hypothetical protein